MERDKEVKDSLGEANVELLLGEVRNGRIKVPIIQVIALCQWRVYGGNQERQRPEQMMMDGHAVLLEQRRK